jgi:hypothetical protein
LIEKQGDFKYAVSFSRNVHEEINSTKLLDTRIDRSLQALRTADVDCANAEDFRALARRHDVFGHALCLFHVAPDDAGVCAQVHHGTHLGAADGTVTAGTEDDFVVCGNVLF